MGIVYKCDACNQYYEGSPYYIDEYNDYYCLECVKSNKDILDKLHPFHRKLLEARETVHHDN